MSWKFLMVITMTCIASALFFQPLWGWDVLGYLAASLELQDCDPNMISELSYTALQSVTEGAEFEILCDGNIPFRREVATNPEILPRLIPFYRGRYLYVWTIAGLSALGMNPARACILISALSFWTIGLLIFSQIFNEK
jgi:hypothetical protein